MTEAPTRAVARSRRGPVAIALVVVGLLLWLAYRLTVGSEHHAYVVGGTPPADFALTAGNSYAISIPGGMTKVADSSRLACGISYGGGETRNLAIRAEDPAETRAINQIASFVAPSTGRAAISCNGLPAVFVDDSDDAGTDYSGLWLVLACIALGVGLPLLLSALRSASRPSRPSPPLPSRPVPPSPTT